MARFAASCYGLFRALFAFPGGIILAKSFLRFRVCNDGTEEKASTRKQTTTGSCRKRVPHAAEEQLIKSRRRSSRDHAIHGTAQGTRQGRSTPEAHDEIRTSAVEIQPVRELVTNRRHLDRLVEERVANSK